MALSFPPNPQPGDTYVAPNGYTYTWDGTKWFVSSSGQTAGGSGPFTVKDEGSIINTQTTALNFIGSAITATSTGNQVNITITAQELTTATTATLGGVKIGQGIGITADGVISVREGLQYWSESQVPVPDSSSTSVVTLLVNSTYTNATAVINAKGNGAIANDNGGNARGAYAVDWQKIRGNTDQVASGDFSVISGGSFNRAVGLHGVVLAGNNNINDSDYSVIIGGVNGSTRGINGAVIMPHYATGGINNSLAKIQSGYYLLSGDTSQTTSPVDLTTDGSGNISASNQITVRDNSAIQFNGTVIAKEIGVGNRPEVAVWELKGTIYRGAGNTTTDLVSVVNPTLLESTTSTSWQVAVSTENNIGCLLIQVQGTANQNIRWVAKIETIELADTGM